MAFETLDLRENFLEYVMHCLENGEEMSMACYCVFNGKKTKIDMPSKNDEEKQQNYWTIKRLISDGKIVGPLAFVAESYMFHPPKDVKVDMELLMKIPPEHRPFTSDCVIVSFHSAKFTELYVTKVTKLKDGSRSFSKWEKLSGLIDGSLNNLYTSAIAIRN